MTEEAKTGGTTTAHAFDVFDERDWFKAEIQPLVDAIYRLCHEKGVPFFATFCTASSAKDGFYVQGPTCFHGDRRTPAEMMVAHGFAFGGFPTGLLELARFTPVSIKVGELPPMPPPDSTEKVH